MMDDLNGPPTAGTITESARPELLDGSVAPAPTTRLHEALDEVNRLRAELAQARTQLSLAQARVAVAERVAREKAVTRLANAAAQARLVVDSVDRPHLAVLSRKQIADQLDARRMLCDYLDRIWRDGQRQGLDQRPEWSVLIALRDVAQYLTFTALEAQMHPISNHAKDSRAGGSSMITTPRTQTPAARDDGPPTTGIVADSWVLDLPRPPLGGGLVEIPPDTCLRGA